MMTRPVVVQKAIPATIRFSDQAYCLSQIDSDAANVVNDRTAR